MQYAWLKTVILRAAKNESVERSGVSPIVLALESSRHFPSAEALENGRIGGRHTECACYF